MNMRKSILSIIISVGSGRLMISVATQYDTWWGWDIRIPDGCNCNMERQGGMIGISSGYDKTIVEIDASCKAYKECHACAFDQCIGHWTVYDLNENASCNDPPNTCKGAVCQCSLELAKMKSKFWNNDLHHHRCRGLLLSIMLLPTETQTIQWQQTKFKNIGIFRCILPMVKNMNQVVDNEADIIYISNSLL